MDYGGLTDQLIGTESGGNPYARNSASSAAGLGQFIDSTWLDTIKRHRPDLAGLPTPQLLALKTDPDLSRQMTQAYMQDNASYLQGRGVQLTPGSLKLAHFAGPAGAAALYANPNATVASLLGPAAVKANPFLANMTGQDAINWADAQMDPSKMMARSIRQKFIGSAPSQPAAAAANPDASATASPMDRLKAALSGKGYDPDALSAADTMIKQGQQIGSGATNWIGALGGPLVSLLGNYQKSGEAEKKKAQDAVIANALTGATQGEDLANTLIASNDPNMRETGIALKAKLATAKPDKPFPIGQSVDQFGNATMQYGTYGKNGEIVPYVPPQPEQPKNAIDPNLKGNDYLDAMGTPLSQKAKNIIAGREALPNATRGDKTALQVQQLVRQADPDYNANRYHYRQQWESPNNPIGKARIANNTAIGHMGEIDKLVDNLPDSSLGPLSYRGNQLYNWWEGGSNNPQLKKWQDTATLLAGEIVKVATGGEGAIQDRERVLESLNPANGRESLKQQIGNYVNLLASKTNALADDWKQTMGPYADQPNLLSGHSRETLQRLLGIYAPGTQLNLPGEKPAQTQNPDQLQSVKTLRYNPQTRELEPQ